MENIENKKTTSKPINKTTETLIKELETMSDSGLHDMFIFFYKLNCQHGNMIYSEKFNEFLEAFNSNPFKHHEDKAFRKELIENLTKYSFDHMGLLTAALLLKKKFTIEEVIAAFEQSEKEVIDLHSRSQGMREAKKNGVKIGLPQGTTLTTKKALECIAIIKKHSKDFGGTLDDTDVIKLCGCSRNSYYKYKHELKIY